MEIEDALEELCTCGKGVKLCRQERGSRGKEDI